MSRWRERIGNAVPVQAGTAIARSLLKALLAAAIGGWSVDGPPGEEIWVRDDGLEVEAPALLLEPELLAADVLQ